MINDKLSEYKVKYNLCDIDNLGIVEFGDETDWLSKRKKTIGGSEIGIVLGVNEYSSKFQLYKNKVSTKIVQHENVYTKKGKELENLIFNNHVVPYFDKIGYKVSKPDVMFINKDTPWLSANVDGLAHPETSKDTTSRQNIIVEIKWVSSYGSQKWDTSEEYKGIPASYYAQVQQYMYITNAHKAIVFALFDDTWDCETYEIPRNDSFIMRIIEESKKFYENNIVMGIPPKKDIRFDSEEIAKSIEKLDADMPTVKSSEYDNMLSKYKALKESMKELENESKLLLNDIIQKHNEGYVPDKVPIKVSITARKTSRINVNKVKELYPEIAKQCSEESIYTWTSIR